MEWGLVSTASPCLLSLQSWQFLVCMCLSVWIMQTIMYNSTRHWQCPLDVNKCQFDWIIYLFIYLYRVEFGNLYTTRRLFSNTPKLNDWYVTIVDKMWKKQWNTSMKCHVHIVERRVLLDGCIPSTTITHHMCCTITTDPGKTF